MTKFYLSNEGIISSKFKITRIKIEIDFIRKIHNKGCFLKRKNDWF